MDRNKPLDFWNWLREANPREYKEHYKYKGHKTDYGFQRGYREYLFKFKLGITKVRKVETDERFNLSLIHNKKGNTHSRKNIPFIKLSK